MPRIPKLLTAADVAERLTVSTRQVYVLMDEGLLGYVQVSRRRRAVSEEQLASYIAKMTRDSNAVQGRSPVVRGLYSDGPQDWQDGEVPPVSWADGDEQEGRRAS